MIPKYGPQDMHGMRVVKKEVVNLKINHMKRQQKQFLGLNNYPNTLMCTTQRRAKSENWVRNTL